MKFQHINTGEIMKLWDLILSNDIASNSIIKVYNADGRLCAKGKWYEDRILAYAGLLGIPSKAGTGRTIRFQLLRSI